jgi:hypothetical protein
MDTKLRSENAKDFLKDLFVVVVVFIEWEGENWIHLAQYMDQWWTAVNTVMNLRVP